MDKTLTEQKIQKILNKFMASWKYNVNGLYVFRWESDKLLWTKAGYIYEFEIKISRADYKNDFKHKAEKHLLFNSKLTNQSESTQNVLYENLYKHEQKKYPGITMDQIHSMRGYPENTKMPNYFYYAVPEGMIEPDEVPPYAGLVYITTCKSSCEDEPDKWYHDIRIVKKAPQLHKTKYTDAELNLGEKFYYNMKTWQHNFDDLSKLADSYHKELLVELEHKGVDRSYQQMSDDLKKAEERIKVLENYKNLYFCMVEGADIAVIERRLMCEKIKEHEPDFDYLTIINEADKIYEERYGSRK